MCVCVYVYAYPNIYNIFKYYLLSLYNAIFMHMTLGPTTWY